MSEVNADGVLLNPHEALLQEVQALTNSLTAEEPEGMEDDKAHTVYAGNGEPAGAVGGVPHTPVSAALAAPARGRGVLRRNEFAFGPFEILSAFGGNSARLGSHRPPV